MRLFACEIGEDAVDLYASMSHWSIGGHDFLLFAWSARTFRSLTKLDRAMIRAASARRQADGSWHLLLPAG